MNTKVLNIRRDSFARPLPIIELRPGKYTLACFQIQQVESLPRDLDETHNPKSLDVFPTLSIPFPPGKSIVLTQTKGELVTGIAISEMNDLQMIHIDLNLAIASCSIMSDSFQSERQSTAQSPEPHYADHLHIPGGHAHESYQPGVVAVERAT